MLKRTLFQTMLPLVATMVFMTSGPGSQVEAQIVPGTGTRVSGYGDDFEDPSWKFVHNFPKSSREQDDQTRFPRGYSINKRWFESPKRGQPDELLRVKTPAGGIPGSEWSMSMRSLRTGVPGYISGEQNQDDLIMNGRRMSVSSSPSGVVRVYIPPFDEWENRSGASFGIRADCRTTIPDDEAKDLGPRKRRRLFSRKNSNKMKVEPYWPGFFICFNSKTDSRIKEDFAYVLIRGDHLGREVNGPRITKPGWWTFGMSCTPDGRIHYYASPGVDDLTPQDHITSQFAYGYKCEHFTTIFFNTVNSDNGRDWTTKWIIDDPALYTGGSNWIANKLGVRR